MRVAQSPGGGRGRIRPEGRTQQLEMDEMDGMDGMDGAGGAGGGIEGWSQRMDKNAIFSASFR